MKKVFIIGTHAYRSKNPVEFLSERGVSAQYIIGEDLSERFEAIINSGYTPDAIIISEPVYASEHNARPAILKCIKQHPIPTLVLGPIGWRNYVETRAEHIHFDSACALSELAEWIKHVCP